MCRNGIEYMVSRHQTHDANQNSADHDEDAVKKDSMKNQESVESRSNVWAVYQGRIHLL